MAAQKQEPSIAAGEPDRGDARLRWRSRVTREKERRLYFAATVVLAVWYLVSRLL
jgi:hypothetical protein